MIVIIILTFITVTNGDYWTDRANLVAEDSCQAIGSSIILSDKEQQVNKILMRDKFNEYDEGFKKPA
jgi:hypothetical protein